MKKFNDMLLAFKWCYDREYEPDWKDNDESKFTVYYDGEEYTSDEMVTYHAATVYFHSREIAQKCAYWLNNIDPKGELIP